MSLQKFSNFFELPLPAGRVVPLPFEGRYLYLIASTGPIEVKIDKQLTAILKPGESIKTDGEFELVSFRALNGAAQTIEFWAGFDEFVSNRINQIEAETEFVPVGDSGAYVGGILAATSSLDLPGLPTLARIRRKAVQVANLDPAVNLLIQNAAGVTGFVVRPGESVSQPISGFLRIRNDSGAGLACAISEIWWKA